MVFALSVYVLRSISLLSKRLPLRPHYSGLPSAIRAFGLGICTLGPFALVCDGVCVRLTYGRVYYVCVRADGDERAGVCLRVHYVDCWSWPLRRTQRTAKRVVKRDG
ncbi:unnamed protein product [Lasius platythorax]|uniref:Secreted protein n=1 Tax=Lasius platythorax TaxID=488582 RepID=A0AAV2P6H6_9HYME